jgi:hypothetical protein
MKGTPLLIGAGGLWLALFAFLWGTTERAHAAAEQTASVRPRMCYEATFQACVDKGPSLEAYPQLADVVSIVACRPPVVTVAFPTVGWRFHTSDGTRIPRPHEGAAPLVLFSSADRMFRYRFWAPDDTASFSLSAGKGVRLTDFTLREISHADVCVLHTDFPDPLAPLGWQLVGGATYMTDANGRAYFDLTGGHANSDPFPVTPGEMLDVTVTGSSTSYPVKVPQRKLDVSVRLLFCESSQAAAEKHGKGWKLMRQRLSLRGRHKTVSGTFVVPEKMRWGRVSIYSGEVEQVNVKRVGKKGRADE